MVVRKNNKVVIHSSKTTSMLDKTTKRYIKAAEAEDDEINNLPDFEDDVDDADGIIDAIDTVADNIEDLQDTVDDMQEDEVDIAINNNIADHYIAECDKCGGIFISAVVESDQLVEYVSGTCPLCGKESEQYLKWIIKDALNE